MSIIDKEGGVKSPANFVAIPCRELEGMSINDFGYFKVIPELVAIPCRELGGCQQGVGNLPSWIRKVAIPCRELGGQQK